MNVRYKLALIKLKMLSERSGRDQQLHVRLVPINTKFEIRIMLTARYTRVFVYLIYNYVIKCVSDMWQVSSVLPVLDKI